MGSKAENSGCKGHRGYHAHLPNGRTARKAMWLKLRRGDSPQEARSEANRMVK